MKITSIVFGILFLVAGIGSASATGLGFDKLGGTMLAYGEIKPGDYQRFIATYRKWDVPPQVFAFDSVGGNVYEAIAIAHFIRMSRIPVWVTGKCYSSCALIYLAAPARQASGEIGLHRTYYEPDYYSNLSSRDAENEFMSLQYITEIFLKDIYVSTEVIDLIKRTPSDKMVVFKGRPETSAAFGEESAFLEEWYTSKCGAVDSDVAVAWCANHIINYIKINSALVEGWKERFDKDPIGESTKHLPGFCRSVLSRSLDLINATTEDRDIRAMLETRGKAINERFECIADAEDSEVWAFFNTITKSDKAYALFDVSAQKIVARRYGR